MLLFTSKARHLIDAAVRRLPDERSRVLWVTWNREHPELRVPGGAPRDDQPPPDRAVVLVVLSALQSLEESMRQQMNADLSEDQFSDLENDLTYVTGLSQLWHRIIN